jgi:hypothetical protein
MYLRGPVPDPTGRGVLSMKIGGQTAQQEGVQERRPDREHGVECPGSLLVLLCFELRAGEGQPNVDVTGPQVERALILGDRLFVGSGVPILVPERGVRVGEAIADHDRESGLVRATERLGDRERGRGFLGPTQAVEQHRAIEVRLDVPLVSLQRLVERGQRLVGTVHHREGQPEQVVGIGVANATANHLLKEQNRTVIIANGEALASPLQGIRRQVN